MVHNILRLFHIKLCQEPNAVTSNFAEIEDTKENRAKFGKIIDEILQSIEDLTDNPFQHQTGYKVDECIKNNLPHLLSRRTTGFAQNENEAMKNCPIKCRFLDNWGKMEIDLCRKKLIISIGKYTSVRWEHYAYTKGGAGLGENASRLTEFTYQQMIEADEIATSFLKGDLGVLEPGAYSKLFCTELQNKLKWNKDAMMWATNEDAISPKVRV